MTIQENIIKEFKNTFKKITLNDLTKICHIKRTRLFRIFNRYEIKLNEYKKMKSCLTSELGNENSLEKIANDYTSNFKEKKYLKISEQLKKKMKWLELIHNSQKITKITKTA